MNRRGSILIVVMYVLGVLGVTALGLSYRAGLAARSAQQERLEVTLAALSRSAGAQTLVELARDDNGFDHRAERWARPSPLDAGLDLPEWQDAPDGSGPVFVTQREVTDEAGKLHLGHASARDLERLGLSPAQIDAWFDWIDPDPDPWPEGAEDDHYLARPTAHHARNGAPETMDELRLVRGLTDTDVRGRWLDAGKTPGRLPGLTDHLTLRGDGRLNLNTASRTVLQSLPIRDEAVEQVLTYRRFDRDTAGRLDDHAFRSADDIDALLGLTDAERDVLHHRGRFDSHYFRVLVRSQHLATGRQHRLRVLVRRSSAGVGVVTWSQD
jgi:type II secretory pathway component PulK